MPLDQEQPDLDDYEWEIEDDDGEEIDDVILPNRVNGVGVIPKSRSKKNG